jgi:hypothetical protein
MAVKDEEEVSKLEKAVSASIDKNVFQSLLWSEGAVPVEPAACMEAVTHHALGKQKEDNCQDDYEQELSYSELWWHSSGRGGRIRVSRHRGCLSAMSGECQGTAIPLFRHFPRRRSKCAGSSATQSNALMESMRMAVSFRSKVPSISTLFSSYFSAFPSSSRK